MLSKLHVKSNYGLDSISELYEFQPQTNLPKEVELLFSNKPKLILHPKSQGSAPEWELKHFNELAQRLAKEGIQVFFSGTEKEGLTFRNSIEFTPNIIDVSGTMNLHEFITFISSCDGLIASSTGPLHIAAALEKHVLGLYSNQRPMFPTRWAPIGKNALFIEIKPQNEFLDITVEKVLESILKSFKL